MKKKQRALISAIIMTLIFIIAFIPLHLFVFKTKPFATMGATAFIIFISYFALRFFDR